MFRKIAISLGLFTVLSSCSNDPVTICNNAKQRVADLESKISSAYKKMQSMNAYLREDGQKEFDAYGNSLIYAEQDKTKDCAGK